jgi:hypothetical protein
MRVGVYVRLELVPNYREIIVGQEDGAKILDFQKLSVIFWSNEISFFAKI